jgi:hypothetical protein
LEEKHRNDGGKIQQKVLWSKQSTEISDRKVTKRVGGGDTTITNKIWTRNYNRRKRCKYYKTGLQDL